MLGLLASRWIAELVGRAEATGAVGWLHDLKRRDAITARSGTGSGDGNAPVFEAVDSSAVWPFCGRTDRPQPLQIPVSASLTGRPAPLINTITQISVALSAGVAETYHAWHGEKDAGGYTDVPGFCKAASLEETQAEIAALFDTTKQNVSLHLKNIFGDGELTATSVVKESLTTAADGKAYPTQHYNLDAILAVGYRVRSPRGSQFRRWATTVLRDYLVKGFALHDERLKEPGGLDYFDELLARIRDIRASERREPRLYRSAAEPHSAGAGHGGGHPGWTADRRHKPHLAKHLKPGHLARAAPRLTVRRSA